jgi:hypothetical protein
MVIATAVKVMVRRPICQPAVRVSTAQLASGDFQNRRVEIEGEVQSSVRQNDGRLALSLAATAERFSFA